MRPFQVLNSSPFTFVSRFEKDAAKTNPEELIGAAHAGCFSMFLGAVLEGDKTPAKSIKTTAEVCVWALPGVLKDLNQTAVGLVIVCLVCSRTCVCP